MAKSKTYTTIIAPGDKVRLSKIDTAFTGGLDKERGEQELFKLGEELNHLQELLYAASTHALLIVLQGMDTSGKDGAIRHVMKFFNPQGCRIENFKVPTSEELAHDFLWRVHKLAPARGQVTVFNRSHYEDVLAVRVLELADEKTWKKRYEQINEFEELLTENNTIVVKFFLHISQEEQEKRLLAREAQPQKAWKLSVTDWENRKLWNDYQRAYEDALGECSTRVAPWHIVPADKKWFRNVAIAQSLVEALQPHEKAWSGVLAAQSKTRVEELKHYRAQP
jgi:PPK2 family polyphosphate:nucleotide phosphotransferase